MMKRRFFIMGILVTLLVFGMGMSSCAAYMRWVRSVDPDFDSRGTITVFPSDSGGSGGSQGGGSQGGGTQGSGSQGSGSQSSGTSTIQQPETITRSYIFDGYNPGQAGAGAAALVRQGMVYEAMQMFTRENPGFEIRNTETSEGIGTLTVTITGRRQ